MGSRGTFVLIALQVPDVRGLQVPGPPCTCFFLAQISLTQRNTYVHVGILDRGLVPKPFGFSQRTVLRAEEARPGVAT